MGSALHTRGISPKVHDKILEVISFRHDERVLELNSKRCRLEATSDPRFALPFDRAVVHGLYSGERREGFVNKRLRVSCCNCYAARSFGSSDYLSHQVQINNAILEVFESAYSDGKDFSKIEGLRDEGNRVAGIPAEIGAEFVRLMIEGVDVAVEDRAAFARGIWREYSCGGSPRVS